MREAPLSGSTRYFAYGANLCRRHMALWCPDAVPVVRATLPGYRLVFRTWADLVESPGDCVQGALYEIDAAGLATLDEFQEYPDLYRRLHVRVLSERWFFDAMAYRMVPGHRLALPDPDYLNLIVQGYRDWKLDTSQLSVIAHEEAT